MSEKVFIAVSLLEKSLMPQRRMRSGRWRAYKRETAARQGHRALLDICLHVIFQWLDRVGIIIPVYGIIIL
ncbi:MAG: hypothetical protein ACRCUX_11590, partial [Beijerinckiaceae bacterium]